MRPLPLELQQLIESMRHLPDPNTYPHSSIQVLMLPAPSPDDAQDQEDTGVSVVYTREEFLLNSGRTAMRWVCQAWILSTDVGQFLESKANAECVAECVALVEIDINTGLQEAINNIRRIRGKIAP